MQSQLVFQEEKERERLRRQNLLLSQAEKPALEHFFKGKSELSVLDIGCNDGTRTFHRFSDDRISRVIGLEYNQQLVERANSQFGNTKFSFYQMDVDRDSFSADLQKLCAEPEDREFDLICLSFVLMHLYDGEKLLRTLKNFLKQTTGVDSLYYRFPGGSSNLISNVPMDYFIHYLNTQGIIYYDWNVSAGDGASTAYTSEEIVENVTDDVVKYKTSVVLLHDGTDKSATVEALGPLIEALEGMGAQILPIDEDTQVIQYVKADTVE